MRRSIFRLGIPVLGICYGMQLACQALGGQVDSLPRANMVGRSAAHREPRDLFAGVPPKRRSG